LYKLINKLEEFSHNLYCVNIDKSNIDIVYTWLHLCNIHEHENYWCGRLAYHKVKDRLYDGSYLTATNTVPGNNVNLALCEQHYRCLQEYIQKNP